MAKEQRRLTYYNIDNPPLLLQGFEEQAVTPASTEDRKEFQLEVNRGVVEHIDYIIFNLATLLGQDESFWNDARIDLLSGGQELLRNEPAERYAYNVDIGNEQEQRLKTWINGGQILESVLKIDPATLSTLPLMNGQLQCFYMTERLKAWRQGFKWKHGNELKRRSYQIQNTAVVGTQTPSIEDVLPKNQGNIIGFSILSLALNSFEMDLTLSVDGIELIKNVNGLRFSRFSQRDPAVFLIPLRPGSTFIFSGITPNTTSNAGVYFVTFYFDN